MLKIKKYLPALFGLLLAINFISLPSEQISNFFWWYHIISGLIGVGIIAYSLAKF
ncbi:MAG: hypothetical protein LBT37_05180 [Lactobacillaceae bacterium]|jgi:hypothetical protein|nr:hypothetical protein [Lactobacillaceae bacterium]